ncbi:MnhB domain-containing protein [Tropicimonas sp. S265A]|uniref:MnhB domain-containing protein n=1 Tax=Tropicimonas sp. S265A TaxID=3415134 RepID=UPI003C7C802D
MNSTILKTATRVLLPIFLIASLLILWRGHNAPGGGFIGGLMAVIGVALYAVAASIAEARRMLRIDPLTLAGIGLACAVAGGLWGAANGGAFLQGVWPFYSYDPELGTVGVPVGSVLLFDTGVYLTVLGAVCAIIFALEEAVYTEKESAR